jgi:hypothetical protein
MYAARSPKPYAPDAAADCLSARIDEMMLPVAPPHAAALAEPVHTARLRRLEVAVAVADERARRFRNLREEAEMVLMRHPLTTERAYEYFGFLLGALPPAAIFYRVWNHIIRPAPGVPTYSFFIIFFVMNLACCLAGWRMGGRAGWKMKQTLPASRVRRFFKTLAVAFVWAACTGSLGGLPFFGVGSILGAFVAMPIAVAAFLLFAPLHGFLARGGMIDARHFWPVACGITFVISALILNLGW